MKKLYRKGTVHPSPSPPPPPPTISDHLSFLPAAILTLTLSLSLEDREVLAYLISCSSSSNNNNNFSSGKPRRNRKVTIDGDHPALFNCSCFRCYMSYWVRWNNSSNHQLIHEIIEAFEDSLAHKTKPSKKDKRNNKRGSTSKVKPSELNRSEFLPSSPQSVPESSSGAAGEVEVGEGGDEGESEEKGSVRRLVSFIGERIWGAWGQ